MSFTYEDAVEFEQNAAKRGSVLGLLSIQRLMDVLGNIQDKLQIIHIAGTNGKGSVGAYLSQIFQYAGLHVGRFCSPAVFDSLEVWQYDGTPITREEYANYMSQVKKACDIMVSKGFEHPTVFEIETAMAFCYFADKRPDVVLLETGMGGLTDATNIITKPLACVITSISFDHMQFLGNSLTDIATVKAGIMKEGCPVFSAPQKEEAAYVLQKNAKEKHSQLLLLTDGDIVDAKIVWSQEKTLQLMFGYDHVQYISQLPAMYQAYNGALAVSVASYILEVFVKEKRLKAQIPEVIYRGIYDATWPGRFEIISKEPLFIIDGAHNEDAARQLLDTIRNCFTNTSLTYIIGVLADKEHEKMLQIMLPYADCVYTVTPHNPRALDADTLAEEAASYHEHVHACMSVEEAVADAIENARMNDCPILAFGSLSYLAEVKEAMRAAK